MKPLHEYAPWQVVSIGLALGVFVVLAGLAFALVLEARIRAGIWGPYSLLLMALGFGLALATPALSAEFLDWLRKKQMPKEEGK